MKMSDQVREQLQLSLLGFRMSEILTETEYCRLYRLLQSCNEEDTYYAKATEIIEYGTDRLLAHENY
jgi:hypothetical protein